MAIENATLARIRDILSKSGSKLADEIDVHTLRVTDMTYPLRRAIADVLMDEFLRLGMTPDHDENEYGLEIESLVDTLNLAKRF